MVLNDARFAKNVQAVWAGAGGTAKKIKVLWLELKKPENKRMNVDAFLEMVRCYTEATIITKRMVIKLTQYIEVYPAVKEDGITN